MRIAGGVGIGRERGRRRGKCPLAYGFDYITGARDLGVNADDLDVVGGNRRWYGL